MTKKKKIVLYSYLRFIIRINKLKCKQVKIKLRCIVYKDVIDQIKIINFVKNVLNIMCIFISKNLVYFYIHL